jgi:hypothetical protein
MEHRNVSNDEALAIGMAWGEKLGCDPDLIGACYQYHPNFTLENWKVRIDAAKAKGMTADQTLTGYLVGGRELGLTQAGLHKRVMAAYERLRLYQALNPNGK